MTTYHLGAIHIHAIDGICRKTALRIAKRTPRNPPRLTWAQLWRTI